jgi:hypothetical protein
MNQTERMRQLIDQLAAEEAGIVILDNGKSVLTETELPKSEDTTED